MRSLKFPILILVVIFNSIKCDTSNSESDIKCCTNSTDKRVVVDFSSVIVHHEYIVQFKNYYQTVARAKFIRAAFDNTEVNCSFSVIVLHCC